MMNFQFKQNGAVHVSNGYHNVNAEQMDNFEGNKLSSLVEWLNGVLPQLHLPLDASEEDLRACLVDGTVLCSILNKLAPYLKEMQGDGDPGPASIKRFLTAMHEMGLPRFEQSDLEQGHMVAVVKCLDSLRTNFSFSSEAGSTRDPSRKQWNLWELVENIRMKQGCNGDFSDLIKSSNLNNASTQLLFSVVNKILSESIERKNGDIAHSMAYLLQKIIEEIEGRVYSRAENVKNQNNLYRAREEKYQSRLQVLESLAKGTIEENGLVLKQLEQIKIEKTRLEENRKLEEQDVLKLRKDKVQFDAEVARLKEELELTQRNHKSQYVQLEAQAEMSKIAWEKKSKEVECLLMESRKKVKDIELSYDSKERRWRIKEQRYQNFVDQQSSSLQALKEDFQSIKHDIMRTKRSYLDAFNSLGGKLRALIDAAENYHSVLAENRRLYNEVQDLKGNIRVYCRIRPFLPGQSKKQTTIEYIGENGELVVFNPLKQGKDNHRLFKFNKVFGPQATQEEVFLDTQPLIRSVLDGYNVCIFAYGQTGSGKTYTMSGPNVASRQDWGVNYRALSDLFEISQIRQSSITYEVGAQMVEIYNEQVRDLLIGDGSQRRFGIWSTTQPNGLAVPEASMHSVRSTIDVLELMNIGLMNRAVGATALNERSSRSHSILTVHVRGTDLKTNAVLRGSLHLVDLAGSERVDRSEVTGDRLKEAQHINKSLSALGDVIFALAQKNTHVPYRNSKLTQVLQSSLGGQAKTLMFVQLNPDVDSYSETISTLKFAERVSGVELGAARSNREGREARELMEQVAFLKDTIIKKDEEIERLQLVKGNANGIKRGVSSLRYNSSSPKNHSPGTPREGHSLSGGKDSSLIEKATYEVDNNSEYSDRHSEVGSHQSVDDTRKSKESCSQSNPVGGDVRVNSTEDVMLLGFGDADSEEKLSDISDSVLSMGTETDGSISSIVEFTLFPEAPKPSEKAEKVGALSKADNVDKSKFRSKLPRPTQMSGQTKSTRLSLHRSSLSQPSLSKSAPKPSSSSRKLAGGSSSTKPAKRWQQ